jgi:hypothetical protein
VKICPKSNEHLFNIITRYPRNLQICLDSSAEITIKEQMYTILYGLTWIEHTIVDISDIHVVAYSTVPRRRDPHEGERK